MTPRAAYDLFPLRKAPPPVGTTISLRDPKPDWLPESSWADLQHLGRLRQQHRVMVTRVHDGTAKLDMTFVDDLEENK